jgi:hypothetical protein
MMKMGMGMGGMSGFKNAVFETSTILRTSDDLLKNKMNTGSTAETAKWSVGSPLWVMILLLWGGMNPPTPHPPQLLCGGIREVI